MQLVDAAGRAYLVAGEMSDGVDPCWVLEGIYD
jgi:hypothetical protein